MCNSYQGVESGTPERHNKFLKSSNLYKYLNDAYKIYIAYLGYRIGTKSLMGMLVLITVGRFRC